MNIEEAIERAENFFRMYFQEFADYPDVELDEEALEIVLESAKLFHKNLKKSEVTVGENLAEEVFVNLWDDYMFITKDQAKAAGIDLEDSIEEEQQ